jgi:hypothetical protein
MGRLYNRLYEWACDFDLIPYYARKQKERMELFDKLDKCGALERMCSSTVHKLFGIKRESDDF